MQESIARSVAASVATPVVTSFPLSLLDKPHYERLSYFNQFIVRHPRLKEVDAALWRTIRSQIGHQLVFVFGPTGVGKTTLCSRIEQRLDKEFQSGPSRNGNSHRTAALVTEAVSPDSGNFNWRDFYHRSLATLEEPFLNNPETKPLPPLNPRLVQALAFNPRLPYCEFRLALEHTLRHRKPYAFIIDDAQHIGKVAKGKRLQDQMDALKSLASKSRTLLVLLGTYELLALRNLSGQLSRKSNDIHFPRYTTKLEDLNSFKNVIHTFQKHLPLLVEPNLLKHWEYLYAHSVGCVGILKDWLTRALDEALDEDSRTITIKMLQRHALTVDQCETIAEEALTGEERLARRAGSSSRLLKMLGFTVKEKKTKVNSENSDGPQPVSTVKAKPNLPKRVGSRKPKRDKVGK